MPEVVAVIYIRSVNNLEVSEDFYCDKLGFTEDFSAEGWTLLRRVSCELCLGHCPDALPMSQYQHHSWFAYFHVQDIEASYDDYTAKGVEIWHELESKTWGMKEFGLVIPDGHRIVFGEQV